MNDALEKMSSSSLSIVEQKPQRPGGCVGVLFQLFDWNRRFAKKKLFAKKLIPPVRSRQLLKNYGGNEKQLKLRLIADENSGGFPNAKKNNGGTNVDLQQSHEMRSPSLVARLMGLESMPALQKNKTKKGPLSGFGSDKEEKLMDNGFGYPREEVNIEKERCKHELRPQKFQRTSCENRPITRTGPEALGFKNVLSRSKKHHPKLPSPAKSPRNISRKNASKLIGAATRILEPGLQTSRSKCALTCSSTLHHPPKRQTVVEEMIDLTSSQDSDNFASAVRKGQASCRNCGHFLDNLDSKLCSAHQPSVYAPPISRCAESSCQWPERCNSGQPTFYHELQEELHDNHRTVAAPAMDNLRPCDTSPFTGRRQRHFSRQHHNPRKDFSPLSHNHSLQSPHQMLQARDRVPPRSKFNSLQSDRASTATFVSEAKNCASSNRNLSRSTSSLVYSRMNDYKLEMEKRIIKRENDSVPPGRKRRPANSRDGEINAFRSPTTKNQMHSSPHAMSAKDLGYNAPSISQQWRRGGLPHLRQRMDGSGEVNNNVVSFAFSSPAKQHNGVEKRRVQSDPVCRATLEKSAFSDDGRTKFERPPPLHGDALGALLKQKLNELTSQGEDIGGDAPKKTTAMILQELISALTSEIPFHQNKFADGKFSISNDGHLPNRASYTSSQTNAMEVKLSGDQPLDCEHPSPGSVLEAHFSNHSCLSSSVDDNLGHRVLNESGDSATSRNKMKSSDELTDILNNISETLCCIGLANCDLKGGNLDHANEVLLKSELIFHTTPVVQGSLSIKHLLLDEMETLASLLWINFGSSLGVEDFKEVNQLNRLVFDSVIEFLDLRFGKYPKCGSKVSTKLPLRTNINILLFEIVEEVRRWGELSRFILDDLIEREMSHSGAEWTEFEVETVETGMDISRHVFQNLLDEIVMDFDDSSL